MADETEPDRGRNQAHDLGRGSRQGCPPTIDPERLAGEPKRDCRIARRLAGFNGREERNDPVRRHEPRHLHREPPPHALRAKPLIGGELACGEPTVNRDDALIRIGHTRGMGRIGTCAAAPRAASCAASCAAMSETRSERANLARRWTLIRPGSASPPRSRPSATSVSSPCDSVYAPDGKPESPSWSSRSSPRSSPGWGAVADLADAAVDRAGAAIGPSDKEVQL